MSSSVSGETRACVLFAYIVLFSVLYTVLSSVYSQDKDNSAGQFADPGWIVDWWRWFPYSSGSSLVDVCSKTCTLTIIIVFILGELTGNVSQVDKLWSVLPCLYLWELTLLAPNPRLYLMTGAATVWGARLTYNFYRRGGYSWPPWRGEEDYRWDHVRQWPMLKNRLGWSLFNLLFISLYQNVLLFLTASPALVCSEYSVEVGLPDWLLTASCLLLVAVEYLADQQQYDYQTEKWTRIKAGTQLTYPYSVGFPSHGLFSISRHPNYTAEISFWFVIYLFSVNSGASLLNWSMAGSVLLCLLFQGSTLLAESITAHKYSQYLRYQKTVPRFLGLWNPFQTEFPSIIPE